MVIRMVLTVALAVLVLGGAGVADAAVTRGTRAPEIDARELDAGQSILLERLRGRPVLLEFFGTSCPHCKKLVPRMNAIHDRYAPRGLAVLGLTPDTREQTLAFRRSLGVRHRVARVPMDTLREYAVANYPVGVLIAPDGRVLWRGKLDRLRDRVIDAYLGRVKVLPTPPSAFTLVDDALRGRRYGEAERALQRLRSCEGIDAETCRYVLGTLDWIAWHKRQSLANATDDERRGRGYTAWRTYAELEGSYPGSDTAQQAAAAKAALLSEPTRAREIHAFAALTEARRLGRWQSSVRASGLLRGVVAGHSRTAAAAEAARLIQILSGRQ